jgi:hypothetical protein
MFRVCSDYEAVQKILPEHTVLSLLRCAVYESDSDISALSLLDAAWQLQPEQAVTLLQQALECSNTQAAIRMCEGLPVARRIARASNAAQLLQVAAVQGVLISSKGTRRLAPALRNQLMELPRPVIEQALQQTLAESWGQSPAFRQLLKFPREIVSISSRDIDPHWRSSDAQWEAEVVAKLAVAAAQVPDSETVRMLCQKPAATWMEESVGERLLQAVLAQLQRQQAQLQRQQQEQQQQQQQQKQQEQLWRQQLMALRAVLALPAVSAKAADAVLGVLQQAVQQHLPEQLVTLAVDKLRAVSFLGDAVAAELVLLAHKQGASNVVALLARKWRFTDIRCLLASVDTGIAGGGSQQGS